MQSRIRELLFTDFDGRPVDDIGDVILEAFDDPRYTARVQPLQALLNDPDTAPYDRFLSCVALATWAELDGYLAVIAAASDPTRAVWYELVLDRKYSVDATFAHLAEAVGDSIDMAEAKGTTRDRLRALRALVSIADEQYFDSKLAFALDKASLPHLVDLLPEVVQRGVQRLTDGPRPSFDLGAQLAELIAAATSTNEDLAVRLGIDLAQVDTSAATLQRLTAIVANGTASVSLTFADYLSSIGSQEVRLCVEDALEGRNSKRNGMRRD